jgi:serine/threonine protein kinase
MYSYDITALPPEARALTALGNKTTEAVLELHYEPQGTLFPAASEPKGFVDLEYALRKMQWPDEQCAALLRAYKEAVGAGRKIPIHILTRWVLAHDVGGAADSVIDCIQIEPPDEVDIIRALPRKGSQKIVFEATWRLRQREVILKKIIGKPEHVARILAREELPHPLTLAHANIIETHRLRNHRGEVFLVEQKLDDVLDDGKRSRGILEAANLLYDIAKAVMYLHDNNLVHGDIKPDNIGRKGDRYILLDFGICRPADEYTTDVTPTGSLKTRAPELLDGRGWTDPFKIDIWALGATVFNYVGERFPLISADEVVPRISDPRARAGFERHLKHRVTKDWDTWVHFPEDGNPLENLLRDLLQFDPAARPTSDQILRRCSTELVALLRSSHEQGQSGSGRFSAVEEFTQIDEYLSNTEILPLISANRRQKITSRLLELKPMTGFDEAARQRIDQLLTSIR